MPLTSPWTFVVQKLDSNLNNHACSAFQLNLAGGDADRHGKSLATTHIMRIMLFSGGYPKKTTTVPRSRSNVPVEAHALSCKKEASCGRPCGLLTAVSRNDRAVPDFFAAVQQHLHSIPRSTEKLIEKSRTQNGTEHPASRSMSHERHASASNNGGGRWVPPGIRPAAGCEKSGPSTSVAGKATG